MIIKMKENLSIGSVYNIKGATSDEAHPVDLKLVRYTGLAKDGGYNFEDIYTEEEFTISKAEEIIELEEFTLSAYWQVFAPISGYGLNPEDALINAQDNIDNYKLPEDSYYIDDSFEIELEDV